MKHIDVYQIDYTGYDSIITKKYSEIKEEDKVRYVQALYKRVHGHRLDFSSDNINATDFIEQLNKKQEELAASNLYTADEIDKSVRDEFYKIAKNHDKSMRELSAILYSHFKRSKEISILQINTVSAILFNIILITFFSLCVFYTSDFIEWHFLTAAATISLCMFAAHISLTGFLEPLSKWSDTVFLCSVFYFIVTIVLCIVGIVIS